MPRPGVSSGEAFHARSRPRPASLGTSVQVRPDGGAGAAGPSSEVESTTVAWAAEGEASESGGVWARARLENAHSVYAQASAVHRRARGAPPGVTGYLLDPVHPRP